MARRKTTESVEKASGIDQPERFRLGDIGFSGIRMFDGVSQEEIRRELNHPHSVKTYRQMSEHPSVSAPLSLYNSMVSKAKFRVLAPKDATEDEKNKAKLVQQMLDDMDRPLSEVVIDIMTMTTHGFSVIEKVYRRRYKSNGSMYDDGIIGIKKLAFRSQESIEKFIFDDDGNEVIGVKQNISGLQDPYNRFVSRKELEVVLPKSKFMLFNIGRNRVNPFGTSPLRDVYLPWRYLTAIEELEAAGTAKDLQGLPVMSIPAQYMSPDASPDQKAVYEQFKNIIRNIQMNSQSGIILPSAVDPDTRTNLFKLELLSTEGKKNYDTSKIKEYYRNLIFIGLSADILLMGNTSTGSFALGNIKNSLTANTVEQYLKKIVQVINEDLIRQIYELNSWDVTRRCEVDFEAFEDIDLEGYSKAIQRIAAVGYLPRNLDVINSVMTSLGLDSLPEETTQEELEAMLPDKTTRSGDGMQEGLPSGTGQAVASDDTSANNLENAG